MSQLLFHQTIELSNVLACKDKVLVPSASHTARKVIEEGEKYKFLQTNNSSTLQYDIDYDVKPNLWLQSKVGFYPSFLAVGSTLRDIWMTGYDNQWRRVLQESWKNGKRQSVLRKKGDDVNYVLFSYENMHDIVFVDYNEWFMVLNAGTRDYKMTNKETRLILKSSWSRGDWLRRAKEKPGSVMAIVPSVKLHEANRIWVRNQATRSILLETGFKNVQQKRIKLNG